MSDFFHKIADVLSEVITSAAANNCNKLAYFAKQRWKEMFIGDGSTTDITIFNNNELIKYLCDSRQQQCQIVNGMSWDENGLEELFKCEPSTERDRDNGYIVPNEDYTFLYRVFPNSDYTARHAVVPTNELLSKVFVKNPVDGRIIPRDGALSNLIASLSEYAPNFPTAADLCFTPEQGWSKVYKPSKDRIILQLCCAHARCEMKSG